MNYEVKVSIALIVYNHGKYLREAIESILMQKTNFRYEIVVGDDRSTDNSREILLEYKEKYPDKFKLLLNKENLGGTKNIYNIFMNCRGKYITCLEGDDYWIDDNKLQKQVNYLEDNKDYLGVSHVIEARNLKGVTLAQYPTSHKILGKDVSINLFLKGEYFSAVATLFRNIFKDEKNDYSIYYKAHKYVGDFTLCMILLTNGKIKILNEVMSVYRSRNIEGESNYNSIRNILNQYEDHVELLNKVNSYFENKYDFKKEYIERTTQAILYSCKNRTLKNFLKVFRTIPIKYKLWIIIICPLKVIKVIFVKMLLLFNREKE